MKVPFSQLLTVCCPNETSRTQKSVTAKPCPDKVGQFFKNPVSQKSLSDILGLQAEDGCPNIAEELWVTVQAASCFCHFSHFQKSLAYISCLLSQYWVSEVVEDQIVVVLSVYETQKRNSLRKCKVYKFERYQDSFGWQCKV